MRDHEFLNLCEARGGGRWTLSLAKVPHDLQTDQTMRHLMSNFARRAAREACDYREHLSDEPGLIQIQEAAQESNEAPFYEVHQFNPVNRYYSIIERVARRFEVDPNIIRAIMYVETTHGYYDAPLSWLGQGHIHRTKRWVKDGYKTGYITYPVNGREVLLKSWMRGKPEVRFCEVAMSSTRQKVSPHEIEAKEFTEKWKSENFL